MDISTWIDGWAAHQPDRVAVHCDGADITYAAMAGRIERLAAGLHARGLSAGDRVAHLGLNSPELLDLVFAAARLGAMAIPLNWRLAPPEHAYILHDAEPKLLLAEPDFVSPCETILGEFPALQRIVYGSAPGWLAYADLLRGGTEAANVGTLESPLLLVYTSGTTGRPRGAVLTQNAMFWNAVNGAHAHDLTSSDHVLTALPMFHVGGLNIQTLPALHAGARVTLHRRFAPDAWLADVERRRPTLSLLVPAVMLALTRHPDWTRTDLSSLRLVMAGSSTIPTALIRPFHERGIPVGQVYGSTETAPTAIYLRATDAMARVGSTGKAAMHCEVKLAGADGKPVAPGEPGEILVRGPNVMSGYWNDPAATAEVLRDGWFHTGDIAHQDADGFYFVDDRKKDLIISGGENIYPAELEQVLAECPEIAEAAVVARADERWGEVAVAVVVRASGAGLDESGVLALFEGRLARFKHPRAVLFVESLPRNVMGKVLKYEIRAMLRPV